MVKNLVENQIFMYEYLNLKSIYPINTISIQTSQVYLIMYKQTLLIDTFQLK